MERICIKMQLLLLLLAAMLPTVSSSLNGTLYVTSSWNSGNETTSTHWNSTVMYSSSVDDDNGTTAVLTTAAPSVTSFWQYHAMIEWFTNAPPVLIVLATVGNTFSVITLQNPMLQNPSSFRLRSTVAGQRRVSDKIPYLGFLHMPC